MGWCNVVAIAATKANERRAMTTCELEHDAGPAVSRADVAPLANGTDAAGEFPPNVLAPSATVEIAGSRRRLTSRVQRFRASTSASILLHISALAAAAAYPATRGLRERQMHFEQGHNTVALAASVASPQSESVVDAQIVQPHSEAAVEPFSRREAEVPDLPAAQFASAVGDRRVPLPMEERRHSDAEEPTTSQQSEQPRPKRTAELKLPPREVAMSVESPASNPSADSRGANRETPKLARPAVIVYPPAALAAGLEGTCKFEVRVNSSGEVVSAKLVQSSGHALLDDAGREAIFRYQFEPFDDDGISEEFRVPIRFALADD